MTFYEAKVQGRLNPMVKLPLCFASDGTIMQSRKFQNRSKYNVDGSVQEQHSVQSLDTRFEDFIK